MPRFTYKDWVGRKARCRRDMQNKAHTVFFKKGEVVEVIGYETWCWFGIGASGGRSVWRVTNRDIELIDNPVLTLEDGVVDCVKQLTYMNEETWAGVPEIVRGVGSSSAVVSSILKRMCERGLGRWYINYDEPLLVRESGKGKRGGYGYRPSTHIRLTAMDVIVSDIELV